MMAMCGIINPLQRSPFGGADSLRHHGVPVVHEPLDAEVLARKLSGRRSQSVREIRILNQRVHRRRQAVGIRRDVARHAVLDRCDHFRGGQRYDRKSHHHGLADGQAEAGVANWIEEKPISGNELRNLWRLDLTEPADLGRTHADEVQWDLAPRVAEEVVTEAAAALRQMIDHHDSDGSLSRIVHSLRHPDSVRNHARGCRAAVPHQTVERGDVDEQYLGVGYEVTSIGGVFAWRIMLEVDTRQTPLSG
jgi:hypothetical protein